MLLCFDMPYRLLKMINISHSTLLLCLLLWAEQQTLCRSKDCHQNDYCKCTFDDGTVLDITSLGNTDQSPRFKDVLAKSEGNFYSYNPCSPFNEMQCTEAAVCIVNSDKSESITIGDASKAAFKYDESSRHVIAGYTSGDIRNLRLSEIVLVCEESACEPEITADGQQQGGYFQMTLKSVCACPNGCDSKGPKNCKSNGTARAGLSGGSILVIAFFAIVIVYFVGGMLFLKFGKKKEGAEIIPNVVFWRSIPVNIKGGIFFLVSKCRRRKGSTYDSI